MTENTAAPQPNQSAQPSGPAPYSTQTYVYRSPVRPPLSPAVKGGAFWAGAVGFNLLSLGFYLVVIPLMAALFGAFFSVIADQAFRSGRNGSAGLEDVRHFFDSLDYGLIAVLGVVVVAVGLLIMAASLFASVRILKSREVQRAWPVTWAGSGIAIAASWFVGWILPVVFQLVAVVLVMVGVNALVAGISQAVLMLIGFVAGNAIIGWLSWWWMAHALRPGAQTGPSNEMQE